MQNRENAKNKYDWGNKIIARQVFEDIEDNIKNTLLAIEHFTKSLFFLRSIEKKEAIQQDDKSIQDVLGALLQAINKLLHLSSDWSQVVDELEKFLIFYVDSVITLNKTHKRLPGLDTLELKIGGPFTVLSANAPSGPQRERLKNYLAVISLFHEDLKTENNRELTSDDPDIKKSFALYKRALKAFEVNVKFESPAEEKLPPSAEGPPPPAVPQPPAAQKPKQPAAVSAASPRFNFAQQPKETKLYKFDYLAPDGPKRSAIRELMGKKEYVKALAVHRTIMNHVADDFRCACECQLIIGEDHARNSQFKQAITCYTEALQYCNHISKDASQEVDIVNIAKVFKALVKVINNVTKNWAVDFSFSSKCLEDFLNFYLDNFETLSQGNKLLSGLDEINMNFLIKFLSNTPDETFRMKTKIYLTIIRMFRQDAKLEKGGLESMIAEIEKAKGAWKDESMLDTFNVFHKALALMKRIKGHPVLNPELNAAPEPKQKRSKTDMESSSSSSLPRLG